jgi:hypothetical protein
MKTFFALLMKCFAVAICSWAALWWAYSMNSRIAGGYFSAREARLLTSEMAGIICLLLLPVQALAPIFHRGKGKLWISIAVLFESFLVLLLYSGFVWWWRENWDISKGLSENAAFGPLVGHVNATFFSGFDGLAFMIGVIPAAAGSAAILAITGSRLEKATGLE